MLWGDVQNVIEEAQKRKLLPAPPVKLLPPVSRSPVKLLPPVSSPAVEKSKIFYEDFKNLKSFVKKHGLEKYLPSRYREDFDMIESDLLSEKLAKSLSDTERLLESNIRNAELIADRLGIKEKIIRSVKPVKVKKKKEGMARRLDINQGVFKALDPLPDLNKNRFDYFSRINIFKRGGGNADFTDVVNDRIIRFDLPSGDFKMLTIKGYSGDRAEKFDKLYKKTIKIVGFDEDFVDPLNLIDTSFDSIEKSEFLLKLYRFC